MKTSAFPALLLTALGLATLTGCVEDSEGTGAQPMAGNAGAGTGGSGGLGGSGGSGADDCTPLEPIPTRLWRLSTTQFSNSVRDLLGMTRGPAVNDTGGASEYAFFSDTAGGVGDTLAFSLYQAVQAALEEVRPRVAQLAACTDGQSDDRAEGADFFLVGAKSQQTKLARQAWQLALEYVRESSDPTRGVLL